MVYKYREKTTEVKLLELVDLAEFKIKSNKSFRMLSPELTYPKFCCTSTINIVLRILTIFLTNTTKI